ncbi:hypothetical protein BJ170DRAFT_345250 [Xylariales sp. AK1849]|nr:hypothetical protein BJ170DRAFT_345250 [Xylariales sp. AK1849]
MDQSEAEALAKLMSFSGNPTDSVFDQDGYSGNMNFSNPQQPPIPGFDPDWNTNPGTISAYFGASSDSSLPHYPPNYDYSLGQTYPGVVPASLEPPQLIHSAGNAGSQPSPLDQQFDFPVQRGLDPAVHQLSGTSIPTLYSPLWPNEIYPVPNVPPDTFNTHPAGKRLILKAERMPDQTRKKDRASNHITPASIYGLPPPSPLEWGRRNKKSGECLFKYTDHGELKHDRVFTVSEIREYLYGIHIYSSKDPEPEWVCRTPLPGEQLIPGKQRTGVTMWIGWTPRMAKDRYPHQGSDKCRFQDCVVFNRTIKAGEPRVIFDERMNEHGAKYDPYHNAGYVHLFCLEKYFDILKLWQELDVRFDTREFVHEEKNKNLASLSYRNFEQPAVAERWIQDEWPKYVAHCCNLSRAHNEGRKLSRNESSRPRHFYDSLTYALMIHANINADKPIQKTRASRRKEADLQPSRVICDAEMHMGNLECREMCVEENKKGRRTAKSVAATAKNQAARAERQRQASWWEEGGIPGRYAPRMFTAGFQKGVKREVVLLYLPQGHPTYEYYNENGTAPLYPVQRINAPSAVGSLSTKRRRTGSSFTIQQQGLEWASDNYQQHIDNPLPQVLTEAAQDGTVAPRAKRGFAEMEDEALQTAVEAFEFSQIAENGDFDHDGLFNNENFTDILLDLQDGLPASNEFPGPILKDGLSALEESSLGEVALFDFQKLPATEMLSTPVLAIEEAANGLTAVEQAQGPERFAPALEGQNSDFEVDNGESGTDDLFGSELRKIEEQEDSSEVNNSEGGIDDLFGSETDLEKIEEQEGEPVSTPRPELPPSRSESPTAGVKRRRGYDEEEPVSEPPPKRQCEESVSEPQPEGEQRKLHLPAPPPAPLRQFFPLPEALRRKRDDVDEEEAAASLPPARNRRAKSC